MFATILIAVLNAAPVESKVKPIPPPEKSCVLKDDSGAERMFIDSYGDLLIDGQNFDCTPDLTRKNWMHCRVKPKEERK